MLYHVHVCAYIHVQIFHNVVILYHIHAVRFSIRPWATPLDMPRGGEPCNTHLSFCVVNSYLV